MPIRCPDCDNGVVTIAVTLASHNGCRNTRLHRCSRCGGTGVIPEAMSQWIAQGRALRDRRLAENRTLREEARRRCMTPKLLCDMESGRCQPTEGEEATT